MYYQAIDLFSPFFWSDTAETVHRGHSQWNYGRFFQVDFLFPDAV